MLAKIAAFELRYHVKSPTFWVALFLFFLLGFGLTASENVQIGNIGAVHENSPWALGILTTFGTIFYLLVVTAFVANAIIRDDATGYAPIMRAAPVAKRDMVLGRFVGGFLTAALGYLIVPFGAFMGTLMPWVDSELIGPQNPAFYLWPYLVMALPNLFFAAAFLFGVATITRSMLWSYVGVVLLVVVNLIVSNIAGDFPHLSQWFARFDLMGLGAFTNETRYWTVFEQNNKLIPLAGDLLFNRVFIMTLGLVTLALTLWRFSFAERPASKRKLRKLARAKAREEKLAAVPPTLGGAGISTKSGNISVWTQFAARVRVEIRQMLRSPGLLILMLLAVGFSLANLFGDEAMYGMDAHPTPSATIELLGLTFSTFIIIIAAFYGGEAVWRERDYKFGEIVDSTPVPAWAMTVPKVIALFLVLLAVNIAGMFAGLLYQLVGGAEVYGIADYFKWFILPASVDGLLIAILAIVVHVLSPNKYVGWGVLLAWFLGTIVLFNMGYSNPLYHFGASPSVPLSDMVDASVFAFGSWVLRAYWLAVALILALGAHLLWPRGTDLALRSRIKRLRRTGVSKRAMGVFAGALVAAVGLGAFTHHNIKVLNDYQTSDDNEEFLAAYERKYLEYEDLVQPVVTDVKLDADLYPDERRLDVEGRLALRNDSDAPISLLHVRKVGTDVEFDEVVVEGASLQSHDEEFGYRIYEFETPLAPGATSAIDFKSRVHYQGFRAGAPATDITPDATFINNQAFSLAIGMDRGNLLTDRQARRRQGLPPELRPAKLEDMSATRRSGLADWVMSDITLTTDADQVPIAPGNRVSDEVNGDRRTARFVSPAPILRFFSIQSGHYEIATRQHGDITFEVYYHKDHDWNVERILDAMAASLDYFEANFGDYQFDHARIVEFPGYATFAQAFAGTMPYSESIGFAAKVDEDDTDFITYVVAHELGHQYWAHQVIPANMQGAALTTETMASYSAIQVVRSLLGDDQVRQFLKYELDRYLRGRRTENLKELPLIRMENQPYIHYRKGGHVMSLLAHRLGEERVNRAAAAFIEQWKFKGAPYHRTVDFVDEVRKVAETEEEQQLITDIFEKIVLFDLKVGDVATEQVGDEWRTTVTFEAAKYEADGKGEETEVALIDPVEIGLFTARPGFGRFNEENVISMEQRKLDNGETELVLTSAERPLYVGIDPYNRYIDRNSEDNVKAVPAG